MNILFLAAEALPYVKVGGLGDVAGSLPAALRNCGHNVRLFMPRYGLIDTKRFNLSACLDNFEVRMDWRRENCRLLKNPERDDYFIENDRFFCNRFQVYGCGDETEQFVLFCRAAFEACRLQGWRPDVIHAHDWHTAAAIRIAWAAENRPGLVFTIHNMAHQGTSRPDGWPLLGVYDGRGPLNLMDQAIWCADKVTTVSPTYAREICSPEYGFGLDGLLRSKGDNLVGIVNGLDTASYDPSTDTDLAATYSADDISGKRFCKQELLRRFNLQEDDAPLVGIVSRLDSQKGMDLILRAIPDIMKYSNLKIVILGSGNKDLENGVNYAVSQYPGRVGCYIGFSAPLSRIIYAGCDIFLMPSLFEPCGLSQMIAMRYGTIPVVRRTGGLADTVRDNYDGKGTGYLFNRYDTDDMLGALGRAQEHFVFNPYLWQETVKRAMREDFTWDRSAKEYSRIYEMLSRQ
ncbi:glycogen synthase [bacterium]|nr:glycogen synthase [bacterium]